MLYPCRLPNGYIKRQHCRQASSDPVFLNPRKFDGPAKTNLKIYMGPEGAGLQQLLLRRGRGCYVGLAFEVGSHPCPADAGACQLKDPGS